MAIPALLHVHDSACLSTIRGLLLVAVLVDDHRRRVQRRVKHWQRKLRRLYEVWLARHGRLEPRPFLRSRAWNKTPDHIEEQIVRLHVEQPQLGAGQLRWLARKGAGLFCGPRDRPEDPDPPAGSGDDAPGGTTQAAPPTHRR